MRKVEQCAKCGSNSLIQRAMLVDAYQGGREQDLKVRVDAEPAAVMFKKSTRSPVHAWICGQCGYMELYADNPGELYQAFSTARSTLPDLG